MPAPPAPKILLDSLLAGDRLDFPKEASDRARALASEPQRATAAEVEGLPEPLGLAILEAAVRKRSAALAEALSSSPRKSLAKAGKKALYQLRSLGVAVAERAPAAAPAVAPTAKAAPEALPALLTPYSGAGERGLILGRPVRGGVEAVQVIFNDVNGLLQVVAKETTRSNYRAIIREPRDGAAPPAMEIPAEEARAWVADAAARNQASNSPYPDGADALLRHFGISPQARAIEVPPPAEDDARRAADGARLHDEPELKGWLPPIDTLRALALKQQEISTSQLYINEAQKLEQLRHQTRAAAEAFFTPALKRLYAGRLWETAIFFESQGRGDAALLARAEARRLFHDAPGLSPFCQRLFEKVIDLARAAEAPPAQPGERRSEGGLILP